MLKFNISSFNKLGPVEKMDYFQRIEPCLSPKSNLESETKKTLEEDLTEIAYNDKDPIVRHEAGFFLGQLARFQLIDGEKASMILCDIIDSDPSLVVKHELIESLAYFNYAHVKSLLIRYSKSANIDLKSTAIISLGRFHKRFDESSISKS